MKPVSELTDQSTDLYLDCFNCHEPMKLIDIEHDNVTELQSWICFICGLRADKEIWWWKFKNAK